MQILVGIVAAYYGPLEIQCFYLFSEGGPFFYPGFAIGSLWFGLLAVHNLAYYLAGRAAAAGGHRQPRDAALGFDPVPALCLVWLGLGLCLFVGFLVLVPAGLKLGPDPALTATRMVISAGFAFAILVLAPLALLWFYTRRKVVAVFEQSDPNRYWTEKYPFPLLVLLFVYGLYLIAWHVAIFFQGMFPLFGQLVLGRQAAYLISLCIVLLLGLMYGVGKINLWAWWASLAYFGLLTLSAVMTFAYYSLNDLINLMNLPEYEIEFLADAAVLGDFRILALTIVPLLGTLGLIVYTRRCFRAPASGQ